MIFISVDLPVPLTPMIAILVPGRNWRLILLSTGLGAPGKVFVRFFMTKLYWTAMRVARLGSEVSGEVAGYLATRGPNAKADAGGGQRLGQRGS